MKKHLPYILIILLGVALILSMRSCARREVREQTIIQAATTGSDSGRIWKDAYDREHRRAEVATGDLKTLAIVYGSTLDSVARLNKVKTKQLEQIVFLQTELRGARTLDVVNDRQPDGHTGVSFGYQDKYLQLSGAGSIYGDSLSAVQLEYSLRDSLIITTIRKPSGLFRKSTYIDVTSANPDMHILGMRSIQIRDRKKSFGLGFQLGASYNGQAWFPYAGLGISYNLIRF